MKTSHESHKLVIEAIRANRDRRLRGEVISIPWSLKRLSKVLPGVQQGKYVIITASPKSGKTQLCDFLYMYEPIDWYIEHKDQKIHPKIFYFSLEMSCKAKLSQAISYKLNKSYGIVISPENLYSSFGEYVLDREILSIISSKEFTDWLKEFESIVTFIDDIRSPNDIYSYVTEYALSHGKMIGGRYIPDDPFEYVEVITDHISLLSPDKGESLFEAMYDYSAYKCLYFRDILNYAVINVQQQSASSAQQQFDYKGNSIVEKIRPSHDGLADCKLTARDVNLMISLFNPFAYNFEKYENIDLNRIGRWHRELYINLNRDYKFVIFGN